MTIRAKNTTIAGQRFQHDTAFETIVKILAGIFGHGLGDLMAAFRAGQGRLKDDVRHARRPRTQPTSINKRHIARTVKINPSK